MGIILARRRLITGAILLAAGLVALLLWSALQQYEPKRVTEVLPQEASPSLEALSGEATDASAPQSTSPQQPTDSPF